VKIENGFVFSQNDILMCEYVENPDETGKNVSAAMQTYNYHILPTN
jgi:hypothetical protein